MITIWVVFFYLNDDHDPVVFFYLNDDHNLGGVFLSER